MKRCLLGKSHFSVILLVLVVAAGAGWLLLPTSRAGNRIKRVVLISIDTCRADYLSCYGYGRPTTPNIDQLAAEGVLFTNAISPAPITLPAHCTMLTGTVPPYHGVHDNVDYRLADSEVTLAEILSGKGFTTGAIVSAYMLDRRFGLNQGFDSYDDRFKVFRKSATISERRGDETSQVAVQWLEKNKSKDFFLFLHYFDPHYTYAPPEPFATRFADNPYAGEVAYTDHCIGTVINKLKALKIYDSTMIVVTADHGEMLGEHGEGTHTWFIYQSVIHVPLIFKVPGVSPARIDGRVGLTDILPTICGTLGIATPAHVQGEDLSGYFDNSRSVPERAIYSETLAPTKLGAAPLLGVSTGRWKYIHTVRPELYDLSNDPGELNNLAEQLPQPFILRPEQLAEILASSVREERSDSKVQLDSQALERIKGLGYIGSSVSEDLQLDQFVNKYDPKDMLKFYLAWGRVEADNTLIEQYGLEKIVVSQLTYDEEAAICRDLIQQWPDFYGSHLCLGQIARLRGDFSAAIPLLNESLRLKPGQYEGHDLLGRTLGRVGRFDEAIGHLQKAVAIKPDYPASHNYLAMTFAQYGKFDRAIEHFQQALALNPRMFEAHHNLGMAYSAQGKTDKAVRHYQESLQINPNQPEAHGKLARIRFLQGDHSGAVDHLTTALALRPDWPAGLNNLAMVRIISAETGIRNPSEAVRLAGRACELTKFQHVQYLAVLSEAYAAGEEFSAAVRTAQTALEVARTAGNEKEAVKIQKYIERYQVSMSD